MRVGSTGGVAGCGLAEEFLAHDPEWTGSTLRIYAARSATTASSTGNPACVTRSRPSASTTIAPSSRSTRNAPRIDRAAGQRGIALGIDAFGEPQPHQQEFVGALLAIEHVVGDDAMAVGLDPHQPGLGAFLGRGRMPDAADVEPAMRARPDAGIFLAAPVDQIVPALRARRARGWRSRRPAGRASRRPPASRRRARAPSPRPASSTCPRHAGRRTACLPRWSIDRATDARPLPRSRAPAHPPTSRASGPGGHRSGRRNSGRRTCARSRPHPAPRARCAAGPVPSARHRRAPARRARRG